MLALRGWRLLAVVLAGGALAAGLGCSAPPPAEEGGPRHFTLGYIPGAQDFVIFVMEEQGLLTKHGLAPEKVRVLNPPSVHLMIAEGRVNIGFGGFTTMATARAQGRDVIVFNGVFSPANMVFVPQDSPLQSISDLRGRKLGNFGGPGSTTTAFLAVIAAQWYGMDLFREVKLVTAPGPALSHLLDRGEIDAALLGTMESIKFFAQGKYRVLADLSAEYKQRQGRAPAHVTMSTSEQFASEHPDILQDFVRASQEAVEFAKADAGVWARYGETLGMTSDQEFATLREKMVPNLIDRWDQQQIAVQQEYLQFVQSVLGERQMGPIPEGLIRSDFNP